MTYRVVFTPEAEDHLDELYRYIAEASTPDIARRRQRISSTSFRPDWAWPKAWNVAC